MFPNKFNVYLHDTPERGLFARTVREFSHGCIRIEEPIELAKYLLRDDPRWTEEAIRGAVNTVVNQAVLLPQPVAVHVLYWTAWADETGSVHFRHDIYDRDGPLEKALNEKRLALRRLAATHFEDQGWRIHERECNGSLWPFGGPSLTNSAPCPRRHAQIEISGSSPPRLL